MPLGYTIFQFFFSPLGGILLALYFVNLFVIRRVRNILG